MSIDHQCPYCKKIFEFSMIAGKHMMELHEKECQANPSNKKELNKDNGK